MEPDFAGALIDAAPVGLLVIDEIGTITYSSPATELLTGYDASQVVGTSILDYLLDDAVTGLLESVAYVQQYEDAVMGPLGLPMKHADGDMRIFETYATNRYNDPLIKGLVVAVRDNTLQWLMNDGLIAYTEGAPSLDVLQLFCQAMLGLPIRGRAAIVDPVTGASLVDARMPASLLGPAPDGSPPRPWQQAVATGAAVLPGSLDTYDSQLREAAAAAGFATVWAQPIFASSTAASGPAAVSWPSSSVDASKAGAAVACLVVARLEGGEPSMNERSRMNLITNNAALVLERDALISELARSARTDALTGSSNRAHLLRATDLDATESRSGPLAALYIDLDGFKLVNDEHGHAAGDAVLVEVARRLTEACRRGDELGRLGGDEFVILCWDVDDPATAIAVADRVLASLARPILVPTVSTTTGARESGRRTEVHVGASVGIALSDGVDGGDGGLEEVVRQADAALYEAKRSGKACWRMAERSTSPASS